MPALTLMGLLCRWNTNGQECLWWAAVSACWSRRACPSVHWTGGQLAVPSQRSLWERRALAAARPQGPGAAGTRPQRCTGHIPSPLQPGLGSLLKGLLLCSLSEFPSKLGREFHFPNGKISPSAHIQCHFFYVAVFIRCLELIFRA